MKRIQLLILGILLLLVWLPSLSAVGLSGKKLSPIIYAPGKEIVNTYTISDTDKLVKIVLNVNPVLKNFISITPLEKDHFDLVIMFPETLLPPGTYEFSIRVIEETDEVVEGASSLLSVSKNFQMEVYSMEKEIIPRLGAPNINEGTFLEFDVGVTSRTYAAIEKVSAKMNVYSPERNYLGSVFTNEKPLPPLKSVKLKASPFDTTNLSLGSYTVEGIFYYDGLQKSTNTTFKIGNIDLELKWHTQEVEPGFNEFAIRVINNWGNEIRNVHAILFIEDEEAMQTPTTTIPAWMEAELKNIVKIEQTPGTYNGSLTLFFESEMKQVPITITVKEKSPLVGEAAELEENKSSSRTILIGAMIANIFIIAVIIIFVVVRTKRKRESDDDF